MRYRITAPLGHLEIDDARDVALLQEVLRMIVGLGAFARVPRLSVPDGRDSHRDDRRPGAAAVTHGQEEDPSPLYRDAEMLRMRAQMDESTVFLALATPRWLDDPICWAQLGYCLMKDKPLLLLVERGTPIPRALRRAATAIEVYASPEDMELATRRLMAVDSRKRPHRAE